MDHGSQRPIESLLKPPDRTLPGSVTKSGGLRQKVGPPLAENQKCSYSVLTKKVQAYEALLGELYAAKEDLAEKNEALERFYDIVVDRELKMVDLEREVHNLKQRLGKDQARQEPHN
jgi:hypothetical protein